MAGLPETLRSKNDAWEVWYFRAARESVDKTKRSEKHIDKNESDEAHTPRAPRLTAPGTESLCYGGIRIRVAYSRLFNGISLIKIIFKGKKKSFSRTGVKKKKTRYLR